MDVLTVGTCMVELTPGDSGLTIADSPILLKHAAGSAAIFACALNRLGTRAALLSAVGADELGDFMIAELSRMGVDPAHITRVNDRLTSLSFAEADGLGGKRFRFYRFPGYSDPLETLASAEVPDSALLATRLFDFTESCIRNRGGLRDSVFELARRSRALGREVCYAPNWREVLWRGGAAAARRIMQRAAELSDIVVLNREEVQVIAGRDSVQEAVRSLAKRGPHTIVVTGGGDFPIFVWSRGETAEVPVFQVNMRYDVGAGDTFHAGFLSGYLRGQSAPDAARFAAATAAIKITRPPDLANLPTRAEVEELIRTAG